MAAQKDNGQEPPESGRRAVIWRLPATQGADDSPDAEADPPRRRRPPPPVVWGLVAALVTVGLYTAWSEVGRDIWSTGGETAVAPAPAPAQAAPAIERTGGSAEGGAAALQPPGSDDAALLAAVEEDVEEDAEAAPSGDAQPAVTAGQAAEADLSGGAEAAPVAPTPDLESPALRVSPGDVAADTETAATEAGFGTGTDASSGARADDAVAPVVVVETDARTDTVDSEAADAAARQADAGADALGMLAARLAVLETQSAASAGAGAALTDLAQRVRALEVDPMRVELDRALAEWDEQRAALEVGLADMRARLAETDAEVARQAASDGRLMALVLASGELTAALGSSRGFAVALETLGGLAGEDPEIAGTLARLAPFAAGGVTTLDGLRARFPEAANAIVRAALATGDADWIDETVTKLSQLVTIRRTGGALDPGSVDGRLVEAETALEAGDLAWAIAIVEPLASGAAGAASAQAWLRDARARDEADDALAALVAAVRARIGARWAAAGVTP